jgi:integrase
VEVRRLLAALGLRAGDVRALRLDDIDWRARRLSTPRSTIDRERAHRVRADQVAASPDHVERDRGSGCAPEAEAGGKAATT